MKQLEFTRFPALDYACEEAINTLCTNITFAGAGIRKIMITSCQASEGKSFLSMNIMRTMAGLGKRVVLVDADMRRSMLEARYGIRYSDGKGTGLAHYLAGLADMDQVLYGTNVPNAYFVPVGREVSNSLSLLSTPRLSRLLYQLTGQVDLVLVDAAPIGVIIDAAKIAEVCDGTVLAVHYNRVRRREMLEARQQLDRTGCPILGAVLNGVTFDSYSSKKYYYNSYYTHYGDEYIKPIKRVQKSKAEPAKKGTANKRTPAKEKS